MIDAIALGKLLAEDIVEDPKEGPCLYPGKFHPPHIGHMKAAIRLTKKDYITQVIVIISAKVSPETGNITPEQALSIWKMYLDAHKNMKIQVRISEYESPYNDMYAYIQQTPENSTVYVAAGEDEKDDQNYVESLQQEFGSRVKEIKVQEKDGVISAPHVRTLVQQRDYEKFKEAVPEAAYNRGAAPKIWKMLTSVIPEQQPEEQPQPDQQQTEPVSDEEQRIN